MSVYFIQALTGGPIKIGSSIFPKDRLAELQVGSPVRLQILAVIPGNRAEEVNLQFQFSSWLSHGEWYHPCVELVSLIAKHNPKISVDWNNPLRPHRAIQLEVLRRRFADCRCDVQDISDGTKCAACERRAYENNKKLERIDIRSRLMCALMRVNTVHEWRCRVHTWPVEGLAMKIVGGHFKRRNNVCCEACLERAVEALRREERDEEME